MRRGFTLIELLIVVAIIGIITAIAIPSLQTAIEKAKQRKTLADMRSLAQAINFYQIDESIFPADGTPASAFATMLKRYAKASPPTRDGWGREMAYASDGRSWYSLESYGRDGIDGVDITPATRFQFELDIVWGTGQFTAAPE